MERTPERAPVLFGACLAASLGLFLAATLPYAGTLSLLTPLPVAYCYYRVRLPGVAVALAGALLISLPGGESRLVALLFLELAATGLVLGELLRRNLGPGATLAAGTLGVLVASAGVFALHAAVIGQPAATVAQGYVDQLMAGVEANLAALGYGGKEEVELTLRGMARLMPSVLVLTAAAVVGLNLVLARRLLRALGQKLPPWPDFSLWRTPEPLVWVLIGAGLMIMAGLWPARLVGMNLLVVVAVAYFAQGLAVVAFYLNKRRVPRPLRLVTYALLSLQQFLSLAVAVVGLFDLWIDFRRLKQAAVEEAES